MNQHKRKPRAQFMTKDESRESLPLPPDPDRRNAHRALGAAAALAELRRLTGADEEDAVSDLLADLMHWCDRFGQKFPQELRRARYHYEEETKASPETTAPLAEEL
jgi:hypothetical protein